MTFWMVLAFLLGCAVGYLCPVLIDAIQFHWMAKEIESRVESMSKIVPPRPKEQQPHPSWRVVK